MKLKASKENRKKIKSDDWKNLKLQQKYFDYFSYYNKITNLLSGKKKTI